MSNLAEKLEEYLDEQSGIADVRHFTIDDKDRADWAVRKIATYQSKIKEAEAVAGKRIAQVNAWLDSITKENMEQIAFFEGLLRPFAEQELQGAKKRSFSLPSGTVGFRKAQPKYLIGGEPVSGKNEKLTKWVKENSKEHLVVKEETNWTDFKKTLNVQGGQAITADGEIVPGIVVEEQPDTFYVKSEG